MTAATWRGWLVAAAIFLLGAAIGAGGMTWFGGRALRNALRAGSEPSLAERAAVRIGSDLTKSLQLTPDESARVQAILDQSAANLRAMRLRAVAQAGTELRGAVERIAAELPPDKRAEFYRVMARRQERLGLPLRGNPNP